MKNPFKKTEEPVKGDANVTIRIEKPVEVREHDRAAQKSEPKKPGIVRRMFYKRPLTASEEDLQETMDMVAWLKEKRKAEERLP